MNSDSLERVRGRARACARVQSSAFARTQQCARDIIILSHATEAAHRMRPRAPASVRACVMTGGISPPARFGSLVFLSCRRRRRCWVCCWCPCPCPYVLERSCTHTYIYILTTYIYIYIYNIRFVAVVLVLVRLSWSGRANGRHARTHARTHTHTHTHTLDS